MRSLSLVLLLSFAGAAFAQVTVRVDPPATIDDAGRMSWRVTLTNGGTSSVDGLGIAFWLSAARVTEVPSGCRIEHDDARCAVDLAAGASRELTFVGQGYHGPQGWFWGSVSVDGSVTREVAVFGRRYAVTTIEDEGPGSLRQVILDVNRDCAAGDDGICTVAFDVEGAIRPRSPLPVIVAPHFSLDGASKIVLDGSALASGDGLALRATRQARVANVAVRNFQGSGIVLTDGQLLVEDAVLESNGLRGIHVQNGVVELRDNLVRNNRHSGGWFWSSRGEISRNVIDGNGASGLFFYKPLSITTVWTVVENNIITNNRHAGIAMTRGVSGRFVPNVMWGNGGEPVDIELDGPTLETRTGIPGQGGRLGAPIIESARWDGTQTIIEGRLAPTVGATHMYSRVYVHANGSVDGNGMAEAEEFIGVAEGRPGSGYSTFSLRVNRDLRGAWVNAATHTMYVFNWDDPAPGTSELGVAVRVE